LRRPKLSTRKFSEKEEQEEEKGEQEEEQEEKREEKGRERGEEEEMGSYFITYNWIFHFKCLVLKLRLTDML
jgi:hypothetical protein